MCVIPVTAVAWPEADMDAAHAGRVKKAEAACGDARGPPANRGPQRPIRDARQRYRQTRAGALRLRHQAATTS